MNKISLAILFTLLSVVGLYAQQDAQYTQYMYNTLVVNPAYAGSRGVMSINGLYRSQWTGFDGAPTTQTFSVHSPVSERLGAGLSIVNDEIGNGVNQNTYFDAAVSYTIPTSEYGKLSLGLKAGGQYLGIDLNQLRNYRPDLNFSGQDDSRRFSPNFGVGAYYHSDKFYLGLSVPNILESSHFDEDESDNAFTATERMNFYFITGYVFDINPNLKFKPALLTKAVSGAPLQVDVSANFLINNGFTLGAAYRWDAAASLLAGFQVSDQFMIGVAYDRETTALGASTFNDGSFEILLRYEFLNKFKKVRSSRFF